LKKLKKISFQSNDPKTDQKDSPIEFDASRTEFQVEESKAYVTDELASVKKELLFQNDEKAKRAAELT